MEKLAIHGGRPVREKPFPPRVIFGEEELAAALDVIEKTMTGDQALDRYGGRHVDAYEQEFAEYFGAKYATSTSSGTAAVHTAIAALGLEPDEVITYPITDPGTVAPFFSELHSGLCRRRLQHPQHHSRRNRGLPQRQNQSDCCSAPGRAERRDGTNFELARRTTSM